MKRTKKKTVLGLILSLVLLFGIMPVQKINAAEGEPVMVDEIAISIKEPQAGAAITREFTSAEPDKYSNAIGWIDWTDQRMCKEGDIFIEGHTYRLSVDVIMAEGYTLNVNTTKVYANDTELEIVVANATTFTYAGMFEIPSRTGKPAELIDSVGIQIKAPVPGESPDLKPTIEEEYKDFCTICVVDWGADSDYNVRGPFQPDTKYCLELTLLPKPGYQFSPFIEVRINGKQSDVRFGKYDPLKVYARYVFTTFSDKTIYDVGINDIEEPTAGKYTSDKCTCDSGLYHVQSDSWSKGWSQDIEEFFVPGVNYTRTITLKAEEGYTFGPGEDLRFTVNGQPCTDSFFLSDDTVLIFKQDVVIEEQTAGKWVSDSSGWWYQYPDGSYENGGFLKIGDSIFYFEKNGYIHIGWLYEDGDWFYFDEAGYMAQDWTYIDGNWYFLSYPKGKMLKDTMIGGYYLNASGAWIPGKWYYSKSAGKYWYSYPNGGYPKDAMELIEGKYYCFNEDGYMVTGWHFDDNWNAWFYFDESGARVQGGWYWINGNCYYFYGDNGILATDTYIDENYVDASGAWRYDQWIYSTYAGKYWYRYAEGESPSDGMVEISGKTYCFDENGYMVTGWYHDEETQEWYYFQEDGARVHSGWYWIGGKCYYFDMETGVMASDEYVDGYYVDSSGAWAA